jgi:hypothetical protein
MMKLIKIRMKIKKQVNRDVCECLRVRACVCVCVAMMESHIYDGDMWRVSETIAAAAQ